ncbi:monocarboxylate permease [Amanita muscaria]
MSTQRRRSDLDGEYLEQDIKRDTSSASNAEQPAENNVELLDGGTQGWLTLLGSTLVQFAGVGYINAFGVYQDFYVREYLTKYSPSAIGWIGGIQLFLMFSSGLLIGSAFDLGYFYHLMIASIVLHGVALFMLSLSKENQYYQVCPIRHTMACLYGNEEQIFLAQGVCFGISVGLTYSPSLAIISHYFNKRRALAIGLASGGSALGAIVHPILLNRLFNSRVGFSNGIRISASITLSLLIVATVISKPRLRPKNVNHPPLLELLQDPAYIFLAISIFLAFGGLFFPVFYLQLDAISHHVDKGLAFYVLSILNAANWFGRIVPTIFAPKFGVFNLLNVFTVAASISLLCMAAIRNLTGVVLIAIFFGFFSGATMSLTPASTVSLARNPAEAGKGLGLIFGIGGIMVLFSQPIAGALLTHELRWLHAILFAGVGAISTFDVQMLN